MKYIDIIMDKLLEVENYIAEQIEDITIPDHKDWTSDHYEKLLTDLKNALTGYHSKKDTKELSIKKIVMSMHHALCFDSMEVPGMVFEKVQGTKLGYEDLFDLFNCNGVFKMIEDSPLESFYNGDITEDPEATPEDPNAEPSDDSEYYLSELNALAAEAEEVEIKLRDELKSWLDSFGMNNSLMLAFEQPTIPAASSDVKTTVRKIYNDHNLLKVINEYDLNLYIPTYIENN